MRNIKLVAEYDGTDYSGWQRQPNGMTLQEILETGIGKVIQEEIVLIGSGRTDAGVHAINQTANFKTSSKLPCRNILMGGNSLLPPDVVIKAVEEAAPDFHARYSAKSKVYKYLIYNKNTRTALNRHRAWHIRNALDISAMRRAASTLIGTHDFSSFCGANDGAKSHVRTVMDVSLDAEEGNMIALYIEANGFLRHMVRNIVGTLSDIGKGLKKPGEVEEILAQKDRNKAGITAPPQGLFLKEVRY